MEHLLISQNSPEWFESRMGRVTASRFNIVLTVGCDTATRQKYMRQLVAERISGEPSETITNDDMKRGHIMEPEAVAWYEFTNDIECQEAGFFRDEYKGCSPDRLVGDDGLLEAKSRNGELQIQLLMSDKVPRTHIPQIQGQIWLAEKEWCDFICYSRGLPMFEKKVYRDQDYINKTLWPGVDRFVNEMLKLEQRIRNV